MHEDAPIEEIRGATRRATTAMVDLALREQVDFLVIAGDVFDGDWDDIGTGLFFNREMSRLRDADIPVYLIRGNHDAKSVITRTLSYPPNVYEFSTNKAETILHEGHEVALHGRGFPERQLSENIVADYPAACSGKFNIGLLHTSLAGSAEHDTYAPCSQDELEGAGYDYWALGHIHQPEIICEEPWIVYSGNTQGRHIREAGKRGCFIVNVMPSGQSSVEFRVLDSVRWQLMEIEITGLKTLVEILDKVDSVIAQEIAETPLAVLRLVFTGVSELASKLERERDQLNDECLSIAQRYNGGKVWVESVRLNVSGNVESSGSLSQHDDFGAEVLAALQPSKLATTFARERWSVEVEKLLKDLGSEQRAAIEALLPDSQSVIEIEAETDEANDANNLQQSLLFETDTLPEQSSNEALSDIHPFLNELRNLTLSALDWSESDVKGESEVKQSDTDKTTAARKL